MVRADGPLVHMHVFRRVFVTYAWVIRQFRKHHAPRTILEIKLAAQKPDKNYQFQYHLGQVIKYYTCETHCRIPLHAPSFVPSPPTFVHNL
jgi:hypothetical protein